MTVSHGNVDAEDAARSRDHFARCNTTPGLWHVPVRKMFRFRQHLPDETRGRIDEPFDREIELRIEGEVRVHDCDSFSLRCVT